MTKEQISTLRAQLVAARTQIDTLDRALEAAEVASAGPFVGVADWLIAATLGHLATAFALMGAAIRPATLTQPSGVPE